MKESFLLYKSFYEPIKGLSVNDKGLLLDAIFEYQINSNEPPNTSAIYMPFMFFKNQFRLDNKKYDKIVERNKINGAKGGRPKSIQIQEKPSGLIDNPNNPSKPKKPDNGNVNDNVNGKEKVITTKNHLFKNSKYYNIEVLRQDIDSKYLKYDLKHYYDSMLNYSESKGVMYKNWLATCRSWINRDVKEGKAIINNKVKYWT